MTAVMNPDDCTLLIRHFPADIQLDDVRELLSAFGAERVWKNSRRNIFYASFDGRAKAEAAVSRLHQLQVLDKRLLVEFCDQPFHSTYFPSKIIAQDRGKDEPVDEKNSIRNELRDFSRDLTNINKTFGFDYPMSSKLFYAYPSPNAAILSNISSALVAVPKFYWQVLHLMNKMNLPVPFGPKVEFSTILQNIDLSAGGFSVDFDFEEEESELESDHEETAVATKVVQERRRPLRLKRKRPRLQQVLNTVAASQESHTPAEVFELPSSQVSKKIEFKLAPSLLQDVKEVVDDLAVNEGFGTFESAGEAVADIVSTGDAPVVENNHVSDEMLLTNCMPKQEMLELPVFKNYDPGKPTKRLYLKNLAKQVEEPDLMFIFGKFLEKPLEDETQKSINIRLMKEGRMKGQAFVTFPDVAVAEEALRRTNGYLLHGKPMVVDSNFPDVTKTFEKSRRLRQDVREETTFY